MVDIGFALQSRCRQRFHRAFTRKFSDITLNT